jgi:hypothetical protein
MSSQNPSDSADVPSVISDADWRAAIIRARTIDPATGEVWTLYQNTEGSTRYLRAVYGLPVTKQTLAHQRSRGVGLPWRYLGQRPLTTLPDLDRYAQAMLRDKSPLAWRRGRPRGTRAQDIIETPQETAPPQAQRRAVLPAAKRGKARSDTADG